MISLQKGWQLALPEVDGLALRYALVFHFSFPRRGFRQPSMRTALYFAGMWLSFIPCIMATGNGLLGQGLYLLVMLAVEAAVAVRAGTG